jgi:hypothetical protein
MTTLQIAVTVFAVIFLGIGSAVALYVKHHPPKG